MLKPWQKINPEKELAAAAYERAIGIMSDETFEQIKAECQERQRQREHFERRKKVRSMRNWRRIIARALRKRS